MIGSVVLDQIDAMPFFIIMTQQLFEELYIGFGVEIILFVFIQKVSRIQRNRTKNLLTIALSF